MNFARQALPGMQSGDCRVPAGRLIHDTASVQSSLRDSLCDATVSRQFLPGYIHTVPPGLR